MKKVFFLQLINDSFIVVFIRIAGLVSGFLAMLLLAKNVSAHSLGEISIGISISMILSLFITLNLDAGALKFLSRYLKEEDKHKVNSYIKLGETVLIFSSAFFALIYLLFYFLNSINYISIPFFVSASLIGSVLFGWIRIQSGYIYAGNHLFLAQIPKSFLRHLFFLLAITIFLILGLPLSTTTVLLFFISSLFLSSLLQWILKNRIYRDYRYKAINNNINTKEVITFCLITLLPILFLELWNDLVIVISSFFVTKTDVAILAITMRISGFMIFTVLSVNISVNPRLSTAIHGGDPEKIYRLLDMATLLKLLIAMFCILFIVFFGPTILSVFGKEYQTAHLPLIIFTMATLIYAILGPNILFMSLLGLQNYMMPVFISSLLLLVILIYLFNEWFGIKGVAFAVILVLLYWNCVLTFIVSQNKGYSITLLGTLRRVINRK